MCLLAVTFFNPWALGFAAVLPVIVALYMLKVRRRTLPVPTLLFWRKVVQENRRRALFQRLRQWLSLLLHLAIAVSIILALGRPTLDQTVHEGSSTVLILDTRARMQAREPDGETRWQKAVAAAKALAQQAASSRQMALLTSEPGREIRLGFTGDEQELKKALETCRPTDHGGSLEEALQLGRELLAARSGEKRIILFTDRPLEMTPPSGLTSMEVRAFGKPLENVGITRFTIRAVPASPETSEALLEVANYTGGHWKGDVEVSLDGMLLDVRSFDLERGEKKRQLFPLVARPIAGLGGPSGKLVAQLKIADALTLDNTAYAVVPVVERTRVLLVTHGNWFLEKLLGAESRIRYELLAPEAFDKKLCQQFDVVILDDVPGEAGKVLDGNLLYLRQTPFANGAPELSRPLVTDLDADHPILWNVRLENITLLSATAMQMPKPDGGWRWTAPLRFGEAPLLLTGERTQTEGSARRVAAFAFGVTESDLPLRVAFPLMISNTVHWLAGRDVPGGSVEAITPFEQKNGFYEVPRSGNAPRRFASNTFSEEESDLRWQNTAANPGPGNSPVAISGRWWNSPLWRYLVAISILLLVFEWWLFHRRRTE